MLTARHLFDAIAVLERVERLTTNPDPTELGRLQAHAITAAIHLRVYGALDQIKVPVDLSAAELQRRIDKIEEQRIALLEALEAGPSIEHTLPAGPCACGHCQFVRMRRAAIAKAEAA